MIAELPASLDAGRTKAYSIQSGNDLGYFDIDADSGKITLTEDISDEMPGRYDLRVRVSDVAHPTQFDEAAVTIRVKPLVVITGDFVGVEGTDDWIELDFVRMRGNVDEPLTVKYFVLWESPRQQNVADRDDLTNPEAIEPKPSESIQTLVIPANQDTKMIMLYPKSALPDGAEQFTVNLDESDDYDLSSQYVPLEEYYREPAFMGRDWVEVTILDSVTLFGAFNLKPSLSDNSLLGVDINDVQQGTVPDCGFTAAIAAMALRDSQFIHDNVFVDNGNGSITVHLYPTLGQASRDETVYSQIERGFAQAKLTFDTDTGRCDGSTEIWPIVLEQAYAQSFGGWGAMHGVNTAVVWERLTNRPATTYCLSEFACYEEVESIIRSAIAAQKKVVVGTKIRYDGEIKWTLSNDAVCYHNHAYVVKSLKDDFMELYNPWGTKDCNMPFSDVLSVADYIYIQ